MFCPFIPSLLSIHIFIYNMQRNIMNYFYHRVDSYAKPSSWQLLQSGWRTLFLQFIPATHRSCFLLCPHYPSYPIEYPGLAYIGKAKSNELVIGSKQHLLMVVFPSRCYGMRQIFTSNPMPNNNWMTYYWVNTTVHLKNSSISASLPARTETYLPKCKVTIWEDHPHLNGRYPSTSPR
jgi:hypothetical protein